MLFQLLRVKGGGTPACSLLWLEVFTGAGRRRTWSDEDKARVIAAIESSGESVSGVARRHGLSPQQLFGRRRQVREAQAAFPRMMNRVLSRRLSIRHIRHGGPSAAQDAAPAAGRTLLERSRSPLMA
nr:transposase [Tardiphaga sp. vice278]